MCQHLMFLCGLYLSLVLILFRMVKEGDHVSVGDEVCEVQSDKVSPQLVSMALCFNCYSRALLAWDQCPFRILANPASLGPVPIQIRILASLGPVPSI